MSEADINLTDWENNKRESEHYSAIVEDTNPKFVIRRKSRIAWGACDPYREVSEEYLRWSLSSMPVAKREATRWLKKLERRLRHTP